MFSSVLKDNSVLFALQDRNSFFSLAIFEKFLTKKNLFGTDLLPNYSKIENSLIVNEREQDFVTETRKNQFTLRYASITSERLCSFMRTLSSCSRDFTCKVVVMEQVLFLLIFTARAVRGMPISSI